MDASDTTELEEEIYLLGERGDVQELRKLVERTSSQIDTSDELQWAVARAFLLLDSAEDARRFLEIYVARSPEDASLRTALGEALRRLGEEVESEIQLRDALRLKESYLARAALAALFVKRGVRAAERVWREAVALAPDSRERLHRLAETLRELDRSTEADELLAGGSARHVSEAALHREYDSAPPLSADDNATRVLLKRVTDDGNEPEVVKLTSMVAQRQDAPFWLLWQAGVSLLRLGRPEAARPILERCAKEYGDQPGAHSELGFCLKMLGEYGLAMAQFRAALSLCDHLASWRQLADLSFDQELLEAERIWRDGVSLRPRSRERREALAEILRMRGYHSEAEEQERIAAELPSK